MFLVVGQGNPGERYARTRHNLGFMVLDRLGLSFRPRGEALVAEAEGGLFLKPLTYYNLTGRAVAPLARFYKIPPERILVVHDEMDLPLGRIRFKAGGSAAGNRGVLSIEEALGTRAFHRLRLGIGKPPDPSRGAEYVLSPFREEELPVVERVLEAIEKALELGLHPVKLNAVVIRGMNEEEVVPLAGLSLDRPLHVRFIEYMHLDNSDPEAYRRRFVPGKETRARIEAVYGPLEPVPHDPTSPARVFKIPGAQGTVGFINPVTEPFCTHCSRLRLTSDKKLRPCLLTDLEMDIAWAFAAPEPVEALVDAILIATNRKPAFGNTLPTLRKRVMLGIGG